MNPTMWYLMESVQSKYSLSERLIRTIAVRSLPHDTVEDLISRGADVNCTHGTLKPLHCACMMSDPDCVELLLENGAEVDARDGYHRAALHYAAEKDQACVEVLLEWGADPDALDGNLDSPLHWAAFKDNEVCVRALLEGGASVEPRDYNRDTPLSWAASRGNVASARVLLEYGAEVRVSNLKGQSPCSRAQALMGRGVSGHREAACLELLSRAAGEAGSLKALSRYAVRHTLGARHLPPAVNTLPLPRSLKDYLLLTS
ncbi:ankyrin repeat and SOCS box protein 8 [Narcine bancroftii]|uniref:ankyrin repeat and SOCS box protein 8 n=1 Tax=Narcine bancroftii TaxID=1343680 RepID=UPI0038314E08